MNGAWRSRIIALWHWFTESGFGFVFVPLVGFQMLVLGMPLGIAVFLLLAVPFARGAMSNRRAPKELADNPFSFCFPGYRESLRRNISVGASYAGLVLVPFGLLFCWIDTSYQHMLSAAGFVLHAISAFFVGVAGYLCISVDFRFVLSRLAWNLLLLLSIPRFMIAIGTFVALIAYPALGIPAGLAVCAFMWVRLGDMACVRRGHRMIVQDALDRQAQTSATRTASPAVEGLFLNLAKRVRGSMTATHLWGRLYRTFGLILSYWKWLLASIVGAALALGYTDDWRLFIALGLISSIVHLPIDSGMLLPEGRREKQRLSIAVAAATTLLLMVATLFVVALSWCFVTFMPHAFGTAYAGIAPWKMALPAVIVPWIFVFQLLDREDFTPPWNRVFRAVAFFACMMVVCDHRICDWTGIPRPILFGIILISGWAFFLPILKRTCMQGQLTGQTPCEEA